MTVAHQFDDAEQQHEAATLGMWTFLATEVLFFAHCSWRIRFTAALIPRRGRKEAAISRKCLGLSTRAYYSRVR